MLAVNYKKYRFYIKFYLQLVTLRLGPARGLLCLAQSARLVAAQRGSVGQLGRQIAHLALKTLDHLVFGNFVVSNFRHLALLLVLRIQLEHFDPAIALIALGAVQLIGQLVALRLPFAELRVESALFLLQLLTVDGLLKIAEEYFLGKRTTVMQHS